MRLKVWAGVLAGGTGLALAGCAGFFPDKTASTTTGGGSTSGDYAYVVNQTQNTLTEFSLAAGALTAITGSPASLGSVIAPQSAATVVVSRLNTYVYVGGQGGIACYSIGTGGALTAVTAGNVVTTGNIVSMDTSPDGQWLLALDGVNHTLNVYGMNTSTGALALNGTAVPYVLTLNGNVSLARAVRIAPNAAYVAIALGTGGDEIFPFTTSTGLLGAGLTLALTTAANFSDNSLAFDATGAYLYVARGGPVSGTSLVVSYSVGTGGALTLAKTVASGDAPYTVLLDSTGTYLYTANRGSNNVSGYSIANGVFTALAGSPYPSGLTATALVEDNSNKYVIAAAVGGSYDYTLYGFDALTPGKLDAVGVGASGSDPAGSYAIAATH